MRKLPILDWIERTDRLSEKVIAYVAPLLLLGTRLWVAQVFFKAGLVKIDSWFSTLYLFQYEYHVPFLPPEVAAYIGTGIELGVPVILVLGLLNRPFALFLFVYNIMAVVSYPALWKTGFYDHKLWGLMMLINVFWGAGAFSLDYLIRNRRKLFHRWYRSSDPASFN